MENSPAKKISHNGEPVHSLMNHSKNEYSQVDILRKAYELILENSDVFYIELEKSFTAEREKRESNLML
jgi:predicted ATPase